MYLISYLNNNIKPVLFKTSLNTSITVYKEAYKVFKNINWYFNN